MKTLIKMFIWKHIGAFGTLEADKAYAWVMKAPIYKRLIRLWCIKHQIRMNYQSLSEWLAKK